AKGAGWHSIHVAHVPARQVARSAIGVINPMDFAVGNGGDEHAQIAVDDPRKMLNGVVGSGKISSGITIRAGLWLAFLFVHDSALPLGAGGAALTDLFLWPGFDLGLDPAHGPPAEGDGFWEGRVIAG